ncbi:DUF5994 family protein [Actinosynnema sp. NPDC002837]
MTLELPTPPAETRQPALRLSMKPRGCSGGAVDGAWWPRSADPATEFPPLLAVLGADGRVRRVSYHLGSWRRAGRTLDVGDVTVRMEGFHFIQPDTVILVNADHTRIRLLVVPSPRANAVHAVPEARGTVDEDRWEGDGGRA